MVSDASVSVLDGRAVVHVFGAELAGIVAGRAEVSAGKSEVARAAAELAAATALASSRYFPSKGAGEAASVANQLFSTDDGAGNLIYYRRTSGGSIEIGRAVTPATLAAPNGSSLVGVKNPGVGSVARTVEEKVGETLTPQDFGANADGYAAPTEHAAIRLALESSRNEDDNFFNRSLSLPTGTYFLTAPVDLLQSFNRIYGDPSALLRGASGQHVLQADGVSFVSSNISRLAIYGGLDGIHAGTSGEIAQLFLDELYVGAFTGTGLYFAAGLTSSRLTRLTVEGIFSPAGHAVHCDGGLNNNNVIGDSDFFNVGGDVVRVENQANCWQLRNVHIEGRGQSSAAQYHLEAPIACHILGGWSEASHEYLIRTTPQVDPKSAGVILDGFTSIGSLYNGGSFTGSKFDTGLNRVIFGSNHWSEVTTAPAQCFIYGVNRKLLTNASTVWTRDTGASFQFTTQAKSATGTTRNLVFTFNRPNGGSASTNQQVASLRIRANFGVLNANGTPAHGAIEWHVSVRGAGTTVPPPQITKMTENDGYSSAGVTATCAAGTPGTTEVVVTVAIGGIFPTEPGFLQAEVEGLSSSFVESDRFSITVT